MDRLEPNLLGTPYAPVLKILSVKGLLTLSYTVSKSHANFPNGLPVVSFTSTAKVNSSKVKKASPSPSNKLNTFWVKSATSALSRT